jgi:hypothetical protein
MSPLLFQFRAANHGPDEEQTDEQSDERENPQNPEATV